MATGKLRRGQAAAPLKNAQRGVLVQRDPMWAQHFFHSGSLNHLDPLDEISQPGSCGVDNLSHRIRHVPNYNKEPDIRLVASNLLSKRA